MTNPANFRPADSWIGSTVQAEPLQRGARKSLAGMDCPEKKRLSRNSGTVHRGVGGYTLDSLG